MYIFIIIMICLLIILNNNLNENFNSINSGTDLYMKPLKNIFLGDNFYNYNLNQPDIIDKTESLGKITFDTFLYSKPTTQKIICSSHTNSGDCWEDNVNNCQWVHKIDGGSFCDVGLNIFP